MNRILLIIFLFVFNFSIASQLPVGFIEQLIAQNLDPTDMALAPDGRIFITFKSGKIAIVENGVLSSSYLLSITVDNYNERGLGHMVLDPNFNSNNYYYVYYTVPELNFNRISRFTANGNGTLLGSEVILMDLDPLSGTIHNAGDMAFGIDGKLYISVGEGANPANSQSFTTVLGKILRINSDGSIPTDNPFYTTATGKNRSIYALGLRNPFSLDIQPGTGKIFVSEVGQETWEEINDIQAGKNYGWPLIEGMIATQTPPANYKDPIFTYRHGANADQGCAVVGAAFYNPAINQFPSTYVGKFYFADYCNGYIKNIDASTGAVQTFATGINRPLSILVAPDGTLYYLARSGLGGGSESDNTSTSNGTLWKVTYTGSGAPFIAVHPKSTVAAVGDVVDFIISASGTQPLTYNWMIDGVEVLGVNSPSYSFNVNSISDNGKSFTCEVSNSFGTVITSAALLTVTTNTRPTPQLTVTLPNGASLYQAGKTISFNGSASDAEDGVLSNASLTWKIDFHHEEHIHPGLAPTSGISSGEFLIPKVGETDDDVWYRIVLTATDSEGLSKSVYQDVFPQKIDITLTTVPPNLTLLLDGQTVQTPVTFKSIIGVTRSLEAPMTQTSGNALQVFSAWVSTSSRAFTFDTPDQNKSYIANYIAVPIGNGDGLKGEYRNTVNQTTTINNSFDGPITLSRVDAKIDFNWAGGSPAPSINNDQYTVRWVGEILPQFSETYKFYTVSDDGIRLWVNNILLIDKWIPQAQTEWSGSINLIAANRYSIRVEYFELGGDAVAKLLWSSDKTPKQIIPQSQLFTVAITGVEPTLSEINIYPQPANSELSVTIDEPKEFVILDLTGRVLVSGILSPSAHTISINELPSGIYLLKTDTFSKRFIKK